MGDIFFQIFLALLGIVIGIISQMVQPRAQRILLLVFGLLLFLAAGLWAGYSIATQESSPPLPTTSASLPISPTLTSVGATDRITVDTPTVSSQFSSPIHDLRVRQAIVYCTDRHALAQSVNSTLTSSQINELLMDSFLPKTHWAYSQPITQYPFDPAIGQALLEQAGWTWVNGKNYRTNVQGEELNLQLTTTTAQIRQTWAPVFEAQMQACGIHLMRLHVDPNWLFGESTGAANGDFELGGWTLPFEENPDVTGYFGCDSIPASENGWAGFNYTGWCNEIASEATKKAADLSLTQSERKPFFVIIQEEFAKDVPIIPLFIRETGDGWEHIEFNLSR